jgi:hydrogenase expression/formation protein HypC
MCLAIPLRVQSIAGQVGRVELGGVLRDVSLMLTPEAQVGNYVLVHTGYAISVLDEDEAAETLALFAELAEAERQLRLEEAGLPPTANEPADGEPAL